MDTMANTDMVLMEWSRERLEEADTNPHGEMMRPVAGMLMNEEINRRLHGGTSEKIGGERVLGKLPLPAPLGHAG